MNKGALYTFLAWAGLMLWGCWRHRKYIMALGEQQWMMLKYAWDAPTRRKLMEEKECKKNKKNQLK